MSSNTSSPLFMKRQPSVSLQRATVSPGVARHQERRRALQHADLRIGVGVDHVQAGVVAVGDELLAAVDHPPSPSSPRGSASPLPARCRAASGRRRRAARSGNAPAGTAGPRRCAGTSAPAGGAARDCAAAPTPSSSAPACRRARIAARDLLGDEGEGLHLGALVELDAAEFLRHAERADADLFGAFQISGGRRASGPHVPFRAASCRG